MYCPHFQLTYHSMDGAVFQHTETRLYLGRLTVFSKLTYVQSRTLAMRLSKGQSPSTSCYPLTDLASYSSQVSKQPVTPTLRLDDSDGLLRRTLECASLEYSCPCYEFDRLSSLSGGRQLLQKRLTSCSSWQVARNTLISHSIESLTPREEEQALQKCLKSPSWCLLQNC